MNAFPSKFLSDNRKSAIQNRKWAGLFAIVCRAHGVRGEGRGAAANENPPDRIPNWYLPFRYLGPHRGIPPGTARAWLRGGEKHCH